VTVELAYPHIEKAVGEPARLKRIPRIRVAQIVTDYLAHGWSVDEMCRQHSYLMPAEAHATMAYYYDHQEEIETEIQQELLEADRARTQAPPTALLLRLRAQGLR
jgi:uncharacterized protein (DUF433 family)